MKCPICGVWTVVHEARESKVFGYRRRRECANGHKFSTQEVVIPQEALDAEREGRRENFKRKVVAVRQGQRETAGKTA